MLLAAAVLLLAGALFLGRSNALAGAGEGAAFASVNPVQSFVSGTLGPLATYVEALQQARDLRLENDILTRQAEVLTTEVLRLREMDLENRRLREMLQMTQRVTVGQLVEARRIGIDPSNFARSMTIDRGSGDGIRPGMVVIAEAGLVGRITEAAGPTSKVVSITDPGFTVSGMVQREDSRATGTVTGNPDGKLIMTRIAQAESVRVDDVIITSGLGGNFPRGLVIGKVTQVTQNDVELFQEAVIEPAVRFGRTEAVAVLVDFLPAAAR